MTDLTKIAVRLCDLPEDVAAALFLHWLRGGEVQCLDFNAAWYDIKPSWLANFAYRAKPEPVTYPSVNWDHLTDEVIGIARDSNGETYGHRVKPKRNTVSRTWVGGGEYVDLSVFTSYTPGNCDWKDSWVPRPKKEGE